MTRVIVCLVLARAATAAAQVATADDLDGTFDAKQHDEVAIAGNVDDRELTDGKMTLHRTAPNLFEGEASAHLVVKYKVAAGGVVSTIDGSGEVTGTVKLQIRNPTTGRYNIQWKLSSVTMTRITTAPGVPETKTPDQIAFKGAGSGLTSFEGNGDIAQPDTGSEINATTEHTPKDHYYKVHWHLDATPLVAIPKVAPVERGKKSHLDGTASTPKNKITNYHWKLEPTGDCTEQPKAKEFDAGATVDVTLLCTMTVKLTVYAGKRASEEKPTTATITPRQWKTKPETAAAVATLPDPGLAANHSAFGDDVCGVEPATAPASGHRFHHTGTSWNGQGYTLAPVRDPQSPFDGWVYVATWKLQYKQRPRYNADLDAGSKLGKFNASRGHGNDLALIRECTIAHENMHDEKMQHYLQQHDPAKKAEAAYGTSFADVSAETRVAGLADTPITELEETYRSTNFFETEVHQALANTKCKSPATICLSYGSNAYVGRRYPSVADIGEGGAGGTSVDNDNCTQQTRDR